MKKIVMVWCFVNMLIAGIEAKPLTDQTHYPLRALEKISRYRSQSNLMRDLITNYFVDNEADMRPDELIELIKHYHKMNGTLPFSFKPCPLCQKLRQENAQLEKALDQEKIRSMHARQQMNKPAQSQTAELREPLLVAQAAQLIQSQPEPIRAYTPDLAQAHTQRDAAFKQVEQLKNQMKAEHLEHKQALRNEKNQRVKAQEEKKNLELHLEAEQLAHEAALTDERAQRTKLRRQLQEAQKQLQELQKKMEEERVIYEKHNALLEQRIIPLQQQSPIAVTHTDQNSGNQSENNQKNQNQKKTPAQKRGWW